VLRDTFACTLDARTPTVLCFLSDALFAFTMKLPSLPKIISPRAKIALFGCVAVISDQKLVPDLYHNHRFITKKNNDQGQRFIFQKNNIFFLHLHLSVNLQEALVESFAVGGLAIWHARMIKPRSHTINDFILLPVLGVAGVRVRVPNNVLYVLCALVITCTRVVWCWWLK